MPAITENVMAKEQVRGAKEKRKPKKDKPKKTGPSYQQSSTQSFDALRPKGPPPKKPN